MKKFQVQVSDFDEFGRPVRLDVQDIEVNDDVDWLYAVAVRKGENPRLPEGTVVELQLQ